MAAGPRKPTMPREAAPPTRGRTVRGTRRLATKNATKRLNKAPISDKAWEKIAARKPARQKTAQRRAAPASRRTDDGDTVLAARLEAISSELQAIPGLRDEVHELRTSIEMLTERVQSLLKVHDEPAAARSEESKPATVPDGNSEAEIAEAENAWP